MYDLYYNVLKENYGNYVNLVHMDTDSLLLKFKNFNVYNKMLNGTLKGHTDLSKFSADNPLYSEENIGKLGLFKSGTGDNPISEVIRLAPKCYSVHLVDRTVKNTAKGVNRSQKESFKMTPTEMCMMK